MVYKFTKLSRQEIDAMLGTKLEETRVFREAQEEKAQSLALRMLQERIPIETIARITEFTIPQIQALQAQAEEN